MKYLLVCPPGEDFHEFPCGGVAVRASSYMGAARGTLTTGSGDGSSSGDYVQDEQAVPLSEFSNWNFGNGFIPSEGNMDPTLEIDLNQLPLVKNLNYHAFISVRFVGLPNDMGMRGTSFYRFGSELMTVFPYAPPGTPPPYNPVFIGGVSTPSFYRMEHYTMQDFCNVSVFADTGDPYDPVGRFYVYAAKRETEGGTLAIRIDQIVFIPYNDFGFYSKSDMYENNYRRYLEEEGVKVDPDLNGPYTVTDQFVQGIEDYQEAIDADDAEFTGQAGEWTTDDPPPLMSVKAWQIVGGIHITDRVVAEDSFTRTVPDQWIPHNAGTVGTAYPLYSPMDTGGFIWDRTGRLGTNSETNVPSTTTVDGSRLLIKQVSRYWATFGDFWSNDFWATIGRGLVTNNVSGSGEESGSYNYGRPWDPTLIDYVNWTASVEVSWDKVPKGTYRNGLMLTEPMGSAGGFDRPPPLAPALQWAAEMDNDGSCYGRLRFWNAGTTQYGPFPKDPPDYPDGVTAQDWSVVLAEVPFSYTPDIDDMIHLKIRRNGYRIRCKIWQGSEPSSWDVDTYQMKSESRTLQTTPFTTTYAQVPFPYDTSTIPGYNVGLVQDLLSRDLAAPGIFSMIDTWDDYEWTRHDGSDPDFWDFVGWPQPVSDPLTSAFDNFRLEIDNPGDQVDAFVRNYKWNETIAIAPTKRLPAGAQYIGFIGKRIVQPYDTSTGPPTGGTSGFPFKSKLWNDEGAPPLDTAMGDEDVWGFTKAAGGPIDLTRISFRAFEPGDDAED